MLNEKDKEFIINEVSAIVEDKILRKMDDNKPSKLVQWGRTWFNWATPPAVVAAIWTASMFVSNSKANQFDSPQQKSELIEKMKNLPDAMVLKEVATHVTDPNVHMSQQAKDSVYTTRMEYLIDRYNDRRSDERMIQAINEIHKVLKVIDYKIDRLENDKN